MMPAPLHIALITPELSPFAKTGGLGDMVGSLGPALQSLGLQPFVIMPKYRAFTPLHLESVKRTTMGFDIWKTWHGKMPVYCLDLPPFFDRAGLYGESGIDYPDNAARFAAFCRAALAMIPALSLPCDLLHVHDWQTALIPYYLKHAAEMYPHFTGCRTLLTVHNFGYQGVFPHTDFSALGMPLPLYGFGTYGLPPEVEFYNQVNFLKAGLVSADRISTVSPTHAQEALTPEFGCGLEGVLQERQSHFLGILNGIDNNDWNPATDPLLPLRYSADDLSGKKVCKLFLQQRMGLPQRLDTPIIALISRFAHQKGLDLVADTIPHLINHDIQWVVLGNGDPALENRFTQLAADYPDKIAVHIGFDAALAHQMEAGADFFLMPSRYEPCGYNQMYSMRYGTIPIVRATGGLKDTVRDFTPDGHDGTGWLLTQHDATQLHDTVLRVLAFYRQPELVATVRRRIMRQDFSWDQSARQYLALYQSLLTAQHAPHSKTPAMTSAGST